MPIAAATGSAARAIRAAAYRWINSGSASEASSPPTPHEPNTRPKRRPAVPTSSRWSIQTTISATKPPAPRHWRKPMIVKVRTPACRTR